MKNRVRVLTTAEVIKASESHEATCQAIEDAYVDGELDVVLYKLTMDFLALFGGCESEMANMIALTSI